MKQLYDYQIFIVLLPSSGDDIEIPVLIGKGLKETYPVGSTIIVENPALQKQVTLKVRGILKPNRYHSNFYSLSSKQYYNFSVIVPVNEEFIKNSSNVGFQLQGLYDMILLQTSKEKMEKLHDSSICRMEKNHEQFLPEQ